MYNFVARFLFKNELPESLLIEVRTQNQKLYTANTKIKSHHHYASLTEHLSQSNYRLVDSRRKQLNFLVLRVGKQLLKLTEREYVSYD